MTQEFLAAQPKLHDGQTIEARIYGHGPTVLLPVNPEPLTGEKAEAVENYGVDPALGLNLITALADQFRVVAFDYEGHVLEHPKAKTLTPDNIALDFLSVANATQTTFFAFYGYSWLALSALQLALRTDRLSALIMGGFSPLHGPYKEMLAVTQASYLKAKGDEPYPEDEWSSTSLSEEGTEQFVTLYEALQRFDDGKVQAELNMPRLCFAGSEDRIQYDENWGNVFVDLVGPLVHDRAQLEQAGWEIHVLEGLDHTGAMQPIHALPVIKPWLARHLLGNQ